MERGRGGPVMRVNSQKRKKTPKFSKKQKSPSANAEGRKKEGLFAPLILLAAWMAYKVLHLFLAS